MSTNLGSLVLDGVLVAPAEDALAAELRSALESVDAALTREGGSRSWLLPRGDPDVRKYLGRLHDAYAELLRLRELGRLADAVQSRRVADVAARARPLAAGPEYDTARALYHDAQLLLAEVGDADAVCGLIESERRWPTSTTSWLTWDVLHGKDLPEILKLHRKGEPIPADKLQAARNQLADLYRARREDELVQRCRAEHRGRTLLYLTAALGTLLAVFLPAAWAAREPRLSVWTGVAVVLAGALGAAVAGTIKARDRLTFESDIRRFRQELLAQLLIGAVAAVVVYAVLRTIPITISDVALDLDSLAEKIALAFAAGFSEPFFLKTIERLTKSGDADAPAA